MLFNHDDNVEVADDFISIDCTGMLMMGDEEEMYLNDDHPFNLSLTQLIMVSNNIMVDVK